MKKAWTTPIPTSPRLGLELEDRLRSEHEPAIAAKVVALHVHLLGESLDIQQ